MPKMSTIVPHLLILVGENVECVIVPIVTVSGVKVEPSNENGVPATEPATPIVTPLSLRSMKKSIHSAASGLRGVEAESSIRPSGKTSAQTIAVIRNAHHGGVVIHSDRKKHSRAGSDL